MAYDLERSTKLKHLKALALKVATEDAKAIQTIKINDSIVTVTNQGVNLTFEIKKKDVANSGFASTYQLFANGVAVNGDIDLAKDLRFKSAELKTASTAIGADIAVGDKYFDFAITTGIAGDEDTHIYLNAKDLVDIYTDGDGLTLTSNKFSVVINSEKSNGLSVGPNGIALDTAKASTASYVAATGTYDSTKIYYSDQLGTAADVSEFQEGVTDVSSLYVKKVEPATAGAMSGTDKNKLDGISAEANKVTVTTEKAGTLEIDGSSKTIVEYATDAEVTEMLNEVFGIETSEP